LDFLAQFTFILFTFCNFLLIFLFNVVDNIQRFLYNALQFALRFR